MKLFEICNKIEDDLNKNNLSSGICNTTINPITGERCLEFEYGVKNEKKIIDTVENVLFNQPFTYECKFCTYFYYVSVKDA